MSNRILKLFVILLICTSMLTSCYVYGSGNRPPDHPGTSVWVCEEPHIEFTIEPDRITNDFLSVIYTEHTEIHCRVIFRYDPTVEFYRYDTGDTLLTMRCKYEKDMFTGTIEKDNVFHGKYDKLVFVKDRIIEDKSFLSKISYQTGNS